MEEGVEETTLFKMLNMERSTISVTVNTSCDPGPQNQSFLHHLKDE